ncbi:MAG: glycosyltransferase family 4 protein [Lachnospiraceae bacterium]|nr:glycosyltransferase family 4 protein [Lachnospiraceae bacterium]
MKRIAFVVQRYGIEVNGGAELHCRQLAEHMAERYDVEILTTKAVDYVTWKNEYRNDVDTVNGLTVRRFKVAKRRNIDRFNRLSETVLTSPGDPGQELKWMELQGPCSPALVKYIGEHHDDYDLFIFFTYLYYTTFKGMPQVGRKSVLIPTAHDEPPIYLSIFRETFNAPAGIFYNTAAEKEFVEGRFGNGHILNNGGYGGVGVEIPEKISPESLRKKYGIKEDFIVYVGRIDESKGCLDLFRFFREYKDRYPSDLKLVLMGRPVLQIPADPDIISLGFVSDEDKFNGIAASKLLVLPSPYESLSMVVLEAMSLKKPVLVNGNCRVLKDHCLLSNGGLYYYDDVEFCEALQYLINNRETAEIMGENGRAYVEAHYDWGSITDTLSEMIEKLT